MTIIIPSDRSKRDAEESKHREISDTIGAERAEDDRFDEARKKDKVISDVRTGLKDTK